jgi:Zn-dependent M16 (insulinase) family peptidase
VKGGAYGCGCAFDGDSGNVRFSSYRDPKVKETLEAFRNTADFVRTAKFDEADLTKYIIGTFSAYERPMSPAGKATRSLDAYLAGRSYESIVKSRADMLNITEADFRAAADAFDAICRQGCICAVGNETRLRENSDVFDTLVVIK